jgi:TPR repeat protein
VRSLGILLAIAVGASPVSADSSSTGSKSGPLVKKLKMVLRSKVTPSSVCSAKEPEDCVALGTQLEYGGPGFKKDPAKAATYYRIACDAKDWAGCTILAEMYMRGKGVTKDEKEAVRLLRYACDQGDCMSLAFQLVDSDVRAERNEGLKIFASICSGDLGYEEQVGSACHMRADRASTRADGAPWQLKACEAGHATGCEKLAQLYFRDEFPGVNAAAGTRALETMCEQQFAPACSFVAQRHFEGKGAKASRTEADRWMQRGCDLGDETLCRSLARRR